MSEYKEELGDLRKRVVGEFERKVEMGRGVARIGWSCNRSFVDVLERENKEEWIERLFKDIVVGDVLDVMRDLRVRV